MFQIFKELFSEAESESSDHQGPWRGQDHIRDAVASLLIEVAKADYDDDPKEREKIRELLMEYFGMTDAAVTELMEKAQVSVDEAIALHPFTQTLRAELTTEERGQVIEMMWTVAYADGVKDANEEYLIRKVADLAHVSHARFIRARQRVEKHLATSTEEPC